jgi:hypothetical protein
MFSYLDRAGLKGFSRAPEDHEEASGLGGAFYFPNTGLPQSHKLALPAPIIEGYVGNNVGSKF